MSAALSLKWQSNSAKEVSPASTYVNEIDNLKHIWVTEKLLCMYIVIDKESKKKEKSIKMCIATFII